MSVAGRIRARVVRTVTGGPAYVCRGCGLTFEDDRLNCPACGCDVRRPADDGA
jgi:rubrerythrin